MTPPHFSAAVYNGLGLESFSGSKTEFFLISVLFISYRACMFFIKTISMICNASRARMF